MTGADIKNLRASRKQTLREMAESIGDISHTTIKRWEENPNEPVPTWVEERIFRTMPITLPLETLDALLEIARNSGQSAEKLIATALKDFVKKSATPASNITPWPGKKRAE